MACSLSKTNGNEYITTMTLHTRIAATEDEAKGLAVVDALKLKPGFGVTEVLCLQVKAPAPPGLELHGVVGPRRERELPSSAQN